jgi:hypothetical protein
MSSASICANVLPSTSTCSRTTIVCANGVPPASGCFVYADARSGLRWSPLRLRAGFRDASDTHKSSHTAVVVSAAGARLSELTVAATGRGYKQLLAFASSHPGRRVWALEGTGSYGAGLTTHLLQQGEWVVEIDRPKRPAKRSGSK